MKLIIKNFVNVLIVTFFIGQATPLLAQCTPYIISSQLRSDDPTILDVVYKVVSDKPTVNVRVLAFQDGARSFAKVIRPVTFVKDKNGCDTSVNVGDNILANTELTLSWKISEDWALELGKLKFEILAKEDENLVPLDLVKIPAANGKPTIVVSYKSVPAAETFKALLWMYASGYSDFHLIEGFLFQASTRKLLSYPTGCGGGYMTNPPKPVQQYMYASSVIQLKGGDPMGFVLKEMGYTLLSGEMLKYVNAARRINLSSSSSVQYGYKIIED